MKMPTSLKQAQADPKAMKQFIREHKGDQIESTDFDKVFSSMTGPSKRVIQNAATTGDANKFNESDA